MSTITQQFSSTPQNVVFREVSVSVTGTVTSFDSAKPYLFLIKANGDNSSQIYITDQEDGSPAFPLSAGDLTPWIPGTNLNRYYFYGDSANDRLHLWLLG